MADEVGNENINLSDGSVSDEDSPPRIKKQKSSTVRRGLAGLINKSRQNTENEPEEDCPSKYAIYSTKVARCLSDRQNNYNLLKVSLAEEDKEEEEKTNDKNGIELCEKSVIRSDAITVEDQPDLNIVNIVDSPDCSLLLEDSPVSPKKTIPPKRTKKLQSAFNVLNRAKNLFDEEEESLNNSLLADVNTDVIVTGVSPVIEKSDILVKILHRGKVYRFHMKKSDPFYKIQNYLADEIDVISTEIMLLLGDRTISANDTPNTIKLHLTDIIDCHIHTSNSQGSVSDDKLETDYVGRNGITLCVQSNSRNSKVNITVDKMEPLRNLMEKYAADRKIDVSSLMFRFDDEVLNPSDTPDDLDMDNGDCIDAIETEVVVIK